MWNELRLVLYICFYIIVAITIIMKLKFLILIIIGFKVNSQNLKEFAFELNKKDSTFFSIKDSTYLKGEKINDSTIYLEIINTKNKEISLFSMYFDDNYKNALFFRRINKRDKLVKLSFIPLITYLSPMKSDLLIFGNNAVVNKFQLHYNFIKIPPYSVLKLRI